ncbi:plasma alpha-L-fucosidase-like [Hyposmocoma kahamanoa]|uniref:plasma alpha-L-fucosidase-like n=1 Tax=Hyposmocoma kahamanoa TaxID=1477025 RepID=UPI000E6D90C1|nr:plasma alpha-L-fucosidase-like [Hyposmocoma kahamanoa]
MRAILWCIFHISIYANEEINTKWTEFKSTARELKSNVTELQLNATELNNRPKYIAEPDWDKLDLRPIPMWYDDAKIGIFIHWGVYSVPGFKSEWFWYFMRIGDQSIKEFMTTNNYESYFDFVPMFTAEKFDPDKWAELFANSGAKYVVITSKHHDGFTLFPSGRSNWNSVDIGPKIDILDAVSKSVRKYNLKFGVYYSLTEWFNKLLKNDRKKQYKTTVYTDSIVWPDIQYIVNTYKPSVLWSDGDWDGSDVYWKSRELLTWLYNDSPVKDEIVVNDRWGNNTNCQHGDFLNCEDRYNPGYLLNHKWENAFTLDKESWGFRAEIGPEQIMTFEELLAKVVSTVSCGGNLLINVGPSKEGIIAPIFQERLLQLGDWLKINGEAIYKTTPWESQQDTLNADAWYTCIDRARKHYRNPNLEPKSDIHIVFTIFLKWPEDDKLKLTGLSRLMISGKYRVELLKRDGRIQVKYQISDDLPDIVVEIKLPELDNSTSKYGWVLKIERLE